MIKILCIAWIAAMCCLGWTEPWLQYSHSQYWWCPLILSVLSYYLLWYRHRLADHLGWSLVLKTTAALALFAVAWSYADQQLKARLAEEIQQRQTVEGVVYIDSLSEGPLEQWRQSAVLLLPHQNHSVKILLYPKKIYNAAGEVTGLSTEPLQLGHFYQVTLDVKPPHSYANPGGFDQEKWLLQMGVQGTATVLFSQELTTAQIQQQGWSSFVLEQQKMLARWRLWIAQQRLAYRQHLLAADQSSQPKALLLALLTGDRSGIDQNTTERYQQMGISHLLAISGPHVLILASLLTWLLMQGLHALMRRGVVSHLYQYVPKTSVYLPFFWGLVSFYVAFTGFEIPAIRTWLMLTMASLAILLKLRISVFTILLFTACVLLWWDCFAILSAAFWLSFVASGMLFFIYQHLHQPQQQVLRSWSDHIKQFFKLLWQSQWRISLALLPIILWQFQAIALISPLMNLVAIPVLSLIVVPLDIIAACLWPIVPFLADGLWWLAAMILTVFEQVLQGFKPLAERLYLPNSLDTLDLICLSFAIGIVMLPAGLIPRFWSILFLCPMLLPQPRALLQLDMLDVGQGQAIVLRTAKHQMLIDTGGAAFQKGQASMGDRVVLPFLRSQGIADIDEILLSHLDLDHSGGTAALMQHLNVKQLRSNQYDVTLTHYPDVPFVQCAEGQQWQWDQVHIEILYPPAQHARYDQNESSCVVMIETMMLGQPFRILLMGDLGWQGEYQLLQRYPDLNADVLVLGHHGSRHSSAYDFLAQVQPKLAMISAGFDNRYGHPAAETLARLNALNIAVVNTADLGAIHVLLKSDHHVWTWHSARAQRQWLLPRFSGLRLKRLDEF